MPTINSAEPNAVQRAAMMASFQPISVLTDNAVIAWPAAAGVDHIANRATAIQFTLPNGGTIPVGAKIYGCNIGAGALSVVPAGGETILENAILPSTYAQGDPFEYRRIPGNRWLRVA